MLRYWLAGVGVAVAVSSRPPLAMADPDDGGRESTMSEVAATGDVCDRVRERLEATAAVCRIVATRKLPGGQKASLIELRGDRHGAMARYRSLEVEPQDRRLTRYILAVDAADGHRWVSASLDYLEGTEVPARPVLGVVEAHGKAAAVVDIPATYARNATDRSPTRVFVACGATGSGAWTCVREELPADDLGSCAVALASTGTVTLRCERRSRLSLEGDLSSLGDGITAHAMVAMAAGSDACEVPDKPEGASCEVVAGRDLGKHRRAALIKLATVDQEYRAVVDGDGQRWLSAPVVFSGLGCGMHHCHGYEEITWVVKSIAVGGKPAVAIELHAIRVDERTDPDGLRPRGITRTPTSTFLVCGTTDATRTCLIADGWASSVSATGVLTFRWTSQINLIDP